MGDSIVSNEKVKTFSRMFIYVYHYMFRHLWKAIIRECKKIDKQNIIYTQAIETVP
jgi:hypothetical protein